jgi:hypothetical protein
MPASSIDAIERLIAADQRARGIGNLVQWGSVEHAARLLARQGHVVIASGFYLPVPKAGETDGPPGAKAIGAALQALGSTVTYVTDAPNAPLFQAMGLSNVRLYEPGLLEELRPTALLATERPGRAEDGRYYSMMGRDITEFTAPVDEMFVEAARRGIPSVAIGDGGNEIGMGNVRELVRRDVPNGEKIASVIGADRLIVAGVSNFGAYGLVGALSQLTGRRLLPDTAQACRDIQAMVDAGACCGHTFRNEPLVDGLPLEATEVILEGIRALVER